METAFNIGVEATKSHIDSITNAIEIIFTKGFETHTDQETIRKALDTLASTVRVENVTIQNCHVIGDRYRTINIEGDEAEPNVVEE